VPDVPPQFLHTIHGKVNIRIRVTVDRSGAVTDAQTESRPASRYFDRVTLEAARQWKFKPSAASESTHLIHFQCRRDGCEASSD
jgi:TonB family protein